MIAETENRLPMSSKSGSFDYRRLWSRPTRNGLRSNQPPEGRLLAFAVCLVTAALLWFTVRMNQDHSYVKHLTTEVENVPADMALEAAVPREIEASLEGTGWSLLPVYLSKETVKINVLGETINVHESVTSTLPDDIRVQNVVPDQLVLPLGAMASKRIPVRVVSDISLVPPFELLDPISATPDSVTVSGAQSVIASLTSWPTSPFQSLELRTSQTAEVELADTLSGLIVRDRDSVMIHISVEQFTEQERELEVKVLNSPPGETTYSLIPNRIRVTYQVPLPHYEAARESDMFYAWTEFAAIRDDSSGTIVPKISIPDGLGIRNLVRHQNRLKYYITLD